MRNLIKLENTKKGVVVLCGGLCVGKTTLCKYFIEQRNLFPIIRRRVIEKYILPEYLRMHPKSILIKRELYYGATDWFRCMGGIESIFKGSLVPHDKDVVLDSIRSADELLNCELKNAKYIYLHCDDNVRINRVIRRNDKKDSDIIGQFNKRHIIQNLALEKEIFNPSGIKDLVMERNGLVVDTSNISPMVLIAKTKAWIDQNKNN